MEYTVQLSGVVNEVYAEMVQLRLRAILHTDSARLASAIRTIATRRRVAYRDVEAGLDSALAFRRF